jgi:ATP-binding cassette subfamily F protein 3
MLQIRDLTYRIAGRSLLEGASLALPAGHKAGLVGPNGCGKSTLLKLIAGDLAPDAGDIVLPAAWRIGRLAQEAPDGPESLLETVLAADTERARLLAEADHAADPHRIAEIHERLAVIEAHSAPARAASILAGLGFDNEAQARPCRDFSGGWRMRVALAALLFSEPDLLLLDEPTNHLDLESSLWLEQYLADYPRTVLIVSHDRDLLNKAVDHIVHLEARKLTLYSGGYDRFERTRAERLEHQAAMRAKQLAQRKHMQAFIDRFRYKASKARQAQSRIKALERMEPIAAVTEARIETFDFPAPDPLPSPLVALEGVAVGYEEGEPVLRRLDLRLDQDDRVALLGANGNGKSTLAKLVAGRLKPMAGQVRRSPKLKIGYFAQHQTEELAVEASPLLLMEQMAPQLSEPKRRAHLARFGLGQERATTPVDALSGGEKARLLFALVTRDAPHVLILDEPTNHLDIDARQALVQALNEYEGAVLLISHDPHLIELVADRLWLVADGLCRPFDGTLEDYRERLLSERRTARAERKAEARDQNGARNDAAARAERRRGGALARAAVAPLKRAAENAEKQVAELARRKVALERELADPAIYAKDRARALELQRTLGELGKRIAAAEEEWLEAAAALEAAESAAR